MTSRQGRQERPINPEDGPLAVFAIGLREVRRRCGNPTYVQLEAASARSRGERSYSSTTLSNAARGDRLPSPEVVRAFVLACHRYAKSDRATAEAAAAEWDARLLRLQAELNPDPAEPVPADPPQAAQPGPAPTTPTVTPDPTAASDGGLVAGTVPADLPDTPVPSDPPGARRRALASRWTRLAVGVGVCAIVVAVAWPIVRATSAPGSASADTLPTAAASAPVLPTGPASDGPARLKPATPSEQPGLEKDSLGPDSRCSPPNFGPGSVKWRVCTWVQADRVSFALEITNRDTEPATVKARLKYTAKTSDFRTCPGAGAADFQILTVPPGQTLTTDTAQCAVARTPNPTAYSGVGWVVAPDVDYGTRVLSPGAHVYPGEIHWTPDVL
ncbi:hypothetical protein [Kitasatospora sp. NPDC058218]|uniref:hypothetical protein n=1 Tax=Kitasatospora sp. NPDC058218 TaxID=3346385 RepID=UPI0036DF8C99